ncbi:glutathione S-transferase-like protein [Mycena polygramma]|nr:glutathione S-transferase-like protein [Mycena polygramma]
MAIIVHGNPQSSNTRRVLLILKEKKIPYELVSIDWAVGEHRQPEWLQFIPFAQIPYIDDDGFILYESRAIGRYLAAAYPEQGPALIPAAGAGVKVHALFEQAVCIEAFTFDPTVTGILTERMVKPFLGLTPDEAQITTLTAKFETQLAAYERILSKTKYLAGDELTLADLFHVPYLTLFVPGQLDVFTNAEKAKKWPSVVRWANELLQREASKSI